MLNMRYKNFIWPNNPYAYSLSTSRALAVHSFPGRGYSLEDLGQEVQVLTGEGEFYGPEAYEAMEQLLKVFREGGAGTLIHPVVEMPRAVFRELELEQEPRENYVRYRFVFWGDGDGVALDPEKTGTEGSHRVRTGESLWQIAQMYDTTVERLLAANPWIENPNALTAGERVVIP